MRPSIQTYLRNASCLTALVAIGKFCAFRRDYHFRNNAANTKIAARTTNPSPIAMMTLIFLFMVLIFNDLSDQ